MVARKFKLIKEYPGIELKLNDVIEWDANLSIPQYSCKIKQRGVLNINPSNFPEYWQKVEELCVPIGTKFKHNSDDIIYTIVSIKNDDVTISWYKYSETWEATHRIGHVNDLFKQKTWTILEEDYFEKQPLFSAKDIEKMWAEVIFSRVTNLEVQLKKELKKKLDEKVNGQ